ncbi:DUF3291 domain-containing protein [Pseudomonas sp. BP8]|uniref:DUF3291 domain-containing protein n=1 Tax=Pseudomonas sp. BP8 TaxID=2817864 RepID=UPI001AE23455|nr:DUF3291 domain-containing protein [Pseudomonas sp. BP8]MBP2261654.1 hypothetical protein [Pseudomonas sp. BP8]HDS1737945.1 DUF3291 domain-containing protein [Pseudomonas putida]
MTKVLAQFDLVAPKYPKGNGLMDPFYSSASYVNGLAEAHPGFVWREKNEDLELLKELWGEGYLYTLSVWSDVESLKGFLFNTPHVEFMRRGRDWFNPWVQPRLVLWWIDQGSIPTLHDAHERLTLLYERGPSYEAFDLHSCDFPVSMY